MRGVPERKQISPQETEDQVAERDNEDEVAERDDDDAEQEIPRKKPGRAKRRPRGTAVDWQKVRLGASLLCYQVWALIVLPVILVVSVVFVVMAFLASNSLAFLGLSLLMWSCIGVGLAVIVLELVGSYLFLSAPSRYGAKRLAQVYLTSEAILLGTMPLIFLLLWYSSITVWIIYTVIWGVAGIVQRFSKPFLFQALARNVKAKELAESWVEYMKLTFGAAGITTLLEVGAYFLVAKIPGLSAVFYLASCILGLVGICVTVWYCRLLFGLRNAIEDYLDNR
jgi:hypothetical protein